MALLSQILSSTTFGGSAGATGLVSLGTVTTVNANVAPSVTVTGGGTPLALLNFSLPQAATLSMNATPVVVANPNVNPSLATTTTNGNLSFQFTIPRAPTISIGTVTTGAAGSSATVTNVGTNGDAVLNFSIPVGATGATGAQGNFSTFLGFAIAVS